MKWFKITIPAEASDELTSLLDMFDDLFIAGAEPKHTALFSSETSANTYYVCATEHSIGYIRLLIESYNASACHKPSEKLTLMAGKAGMFD
jgi:gamma-glutamyl-gamma-aminobutyrate hydrolase PuuD